MEVLGVLIFAVSIFLSFVMMPALALWIFIAKPSDEVLKKKESVIGSLYEAMKVENRV